MRRQQGIKITKRIHDTILSIEFLKQFRRSEQYFTRKRKLTFVNLVAFILNFLSKSTQAELNQFFDFMTIKERISQQAFSKARQKISPEAFKHLFEHLPNVEFLMKPELLEDFLPWAKNIQEHCKGI